MIYSKKQDDTIVLELNPIEQHLIAKALCHYAIHAFSITGNINHTEAVEKLSGEFTDAYCAKYSSENAALQFDFKGLEISQIDKDIQDYFDKSK